MPQYPLFLAVFGLFTFLLCVSPVSAYPRYKWMKRQIDRDDIQQEYDYIVVGGGQSGLVIANRLSEDPSCQYPFTIVLCIGQQGAKENQEAKQLTTETTIVTVLVIEYGYFENDISQIQPQSAKSFQRKHLYNVTSIPQLGLHNRTATTFAAAVVGGGSTVNGMFLNRGAADDYNNWEKLGNPGWNFEGILPYFIKVRSHRFHSKATEEVC